MMNETTTQMLPSIVAELSASLVLREGSRLLITVTVVAATFGHHNWRTLP